MTKTVKDERYLCVSAYVRALEAQLLTDGDLQRMIDADDVREAIRVLTDHGYPEMAPHMVSLEDTLRHHREALMASLSDFLPEGAKVFRLLEADMAPVLNKGAMVAVLPGAIAEDGDIVAVFAGRQLQFRRVHRREGGWLLSVQEPQGQEERFIGDEQWPLYYYGKAVWAFQPLS